MATPIGWNRVWSAMDPLSIRNYQAGEWDAWLKKFRELVSSLPGQDCPDREMVDLLLRNLGSEVIHIYNSFNVDLSTLTFDELIERFTLYFNPLFARSVFLHTKQLSFETFEQFAEKLSILCGPCDFGSASLQEKMIRDMFLSNMLDKYDYIRTKIYRKYPDPNLKQTLEYTNSIFRGKGVTSQSRSSGFRFPNEHRRTNGSCFKYGLSVSPGDTLEVAVLHVHNDLVHVIPVDSEDMRDKFVADLNSAMGHVSRPSKPEQGNKYCVLLKGTWYRVVVTNVDSDRRLASVHSLDFGWQATVNFSDFLNTPLDFRVVEPLVLSISFEDPWPKNIKEKQRLRVRFLSKENNLWSVSLADSPKVENDGFETNSESEESSAFDGHKTSVNRNNRFGNRNGNQNSNKVYNKKNFDSAEREGGATKFVMHNKNDFDGTEKKGSARLMKQDNHRCDNDFDRDSSSQNDMFGGNRENVVKGTGSANSRQNHLPYKNRNNSSKMGRDKNRRSLDSEHEMSRKGERNNRNSRCNSNRMGTNDGAHSQGVLMRNSWHSEKRTEMKEEIDSGRSSQIQESKRMMNGSGESVANERSQSMNLNIDPRRFQGHNGKTNEGNFDRSYDSHNFGQQKNMGDNEKLGVEKTIYDKTVVDNSSSDRSHEEKRNKITPGINVKMDTGAIPKSVPLQTGKDDTKVSEGIPKPGRNSLSKFKNPNGRGLDYKCSLDISKLSLDANTCEPAREPPCPPNCYTNVMITNILPDGVAYVMLAADEDKLGDIFKQLDINSTDSNILLNPMKGSMCAVPYDDGWWRAEIVGVKTSKEMVKAFIIDSGVTEIFSFSQITILPKELEHLPPLCFKIKGPKSFSFDGIDYVQIKPKSQDDDGAWVVAIKGFDEAEGMRQTVKEEPADTGINIVARSSPNQSNNHVSLRKPHPPPIPRNSFTAVKIVYCGPEGTFVTAETDFDSMFDICQTVANGDYTPCQAPRLQEMCVAPFDGIPFRAKVLAIDWKNQKCHVVFVDYGNESDVDLNELYHLPTSLNERIYTFKIRLDSKSDIELKENEVVKVSPVALEPDGSWFVQLEGEPISDDYNLPDPSEGRTNAYDNFISFSRDLKK